MQILSDLLQQMLPSNLKFIENCIKKTKSTRLVLPITPLSRPIDLTLGLTFLKLEL